MRDFKISEGAWPVQCLLLLATKPISIAVQRGNATSVMGSVGQDAVEDFAL